MLPWSSVEEISGMVLRVNAMVDTMMKDIEITATTCEIKEGEILL